MHACPLLRDDVVVEPFEPDDGRNRFIVAVDHQHFVVDSSTAILIDALRQATTYDELASKLGGEVGHTLAEGEVREVVEKRLPRSLFEQTGEAASSPLSWQRLLFTAQTLDPLVRLTRRLVSWPAAAATVLALVIVDVAVVHRYLAGAASLSAHGWSLLLAPLLIVLGVLIHELGHVSALARFGGKSGGIGFGIYWFFPTFYADVTATWRLPSRQRAVVDVGGLHFQAMYMVLIGTWALLAKDPTLPMIVMWFTHFMMLYTLNPALKFDGYWMISDLTRTTNLHQQIRRTATALAARLIRRQHEGVPPRRELLMLGGFSIAALAYFSYVFISLSHSIAHAAAVVAGPDRPGWPALVATSILGALLLFIVVMIALNCARVLASVIAPRTAPRQEQPE
jgi:putative peptide zinc metalloprotease protein